MSRFKRIEVKWADHWIDSGDHDYNNVIQKAKPRYGNYTGYLVFENKQIIILCSNYWDEEGSEHLEVSDPMYIMKRSIVSRSDKNGS